MRTALQIDITFEQILDLVKRLPKRDKIKLTQELEKEGINSKLSKLLNTFKTDKLSAKDINSEVEIVRQQLYDQKKR
jgi:hypothetical protein